MPSLRRRFCDHDHSRPDEEEFQQPCPIDPRRPLEAFMRRMRLATGVIVTAKTPSAHLNSSYPLLRCCSPTRSE